MIEWLDEFYGDPDLKATTLRNFSPVFETYVNEAVGPVNPEFVQSLVESYVDRYLDSSRAQLQEVVKGSDNPLADLAKRFEEWEAKRPEKVSRNELVRSANAASVENLRTAGVTKKKWVSGGGDTCPFCVSLNGTVIAVDGNYFTKGDTLNPEGATAPIHFESSLGHPPIHQGCNCSVESAYNEENIAKWMGEDEAGLRAGLKDPRLQGKNLLPALARIRDEFEEALRRKKFVPTPFVPKRLPSRPRGTPDRATVQWAKELWGSKTGPFFKSLSQAEMDAVTRYSGKDYVPVNRFLRRGTGGSGALTRRIEALESAINRTAIDRDVVVSRGTTLSAFQRYHPKTFIGKEIMEPGFMSTSTKAGIAGDFGGYAHAVNMKITAPQGTRALYMDPVSQVKGEQELLFGRGTRMRVDRVVERNIRGRLGGPDHIEYDVFVTIVGP